MSRLGRVNFRDVGTPAFLNGTGWNESDRYSEQTAHEIDMEVRRILDTATQDSARHPAQRRPAFGSCGRALIEKEVIDGEELRRLLAEFVAPNANGRNGPGGPSSVSWGLWR